MVFSLLMKGTVELSANRLATKAASQEAFNGGAPTAFTSPDIIERYFQKYGSTQRKFDFHPKPGFYIGYVKMDGQPEFLSVVVIHPTGSVAVSYLPDFSHGQDLLGLTGKKLFADQVASAFVEASGG